MNRASRQIEDPNQKAKERSSFLKKKQKTFICFGLGFSGWAQPE
jgi:hypothetical protein